MELTADELSMPPGWRLSSISSHAEFIRGVSWRKSEETTCVLGTLVVSIPNIRDGTIDFYSKYNHFLKKDLPEDKLLRLDDIVFVGSSGSVENVARNAIVSSLPAEPVGFASFTFVGRRKSNDIDIWFLYYVLRSRLFPVSMFCKRAADGKFNFQLTDFTRNFRFPLPPLDEQRQIAAVLSAVQRAIERQERLIALTAELKKALMHKLFTEGTRGEPLKQTESGPVPQSWNVIEFEAFSVLQRGQDLPKSTFRPGNVPVIGATTTIGFHDTANVKGPGVTIVRSGSSAGKALYDSNG